MNVCSDKSILGRTAPHSEQVLVLGNHRSTFSKANPSQPHRYSNLVINRPALPPEKQLWQFCWDYHQGRLLT